MYRVTETIHHGQYRNVQTSDGISVRAAFETALQTSPYNFTAGFDNRYVGECYSDLVEYGRGDFGWAHYTVEELP